MSDAPYVGGSAISQQGILGGSPVQALDTDLQNLVKAVNRVAQLLTPAPASVITGSRASGAALTSLLAALVARGLIIDDTTA